ncbi:MAG: hypothetical protein ACRDJU_02415 [Actinomycetota bacterium]
MRSLRNGRTREQVGDDLIEAAMRAPRLVAGLDFAFSFPAWFLAEQGFAGAAELWDAARVRGEDWLVERSAPFWGGRVASGRGVMREAARGAARPDLGDRAHFRRTDLWVAPTGPRRIRPKSPFQVGGAGSVGTGSIRGMPLLARLQREGFSIWPFDAEPGWPRIVEIYPRLLTGPVDKANGPARQASLEAFDWPPDPVQRQLAGSSEDAFDAALSARAMDEHQDRLVDLPEIPAESAAEARLEGWIWST